MPRNLPREGKSFRVELGGDGLHAETVGVQAEDPADDLSLGLEDDPCRAVGSVRRPIAEKPTAGAATGEGAARQPAVGLVAQVVEVELVDQALDGDLELGHLVAGLDAVGDGDELDAVALEATKEGERFDEIARQPRQVVDEDGGEGRGRRERSGHEALIRRALLDAEPGQGRVLVDVLIQDLPAHLRRESTTVPDLVVQGGGALHVGTEPRVDGALFHDAELSVLSAVARSARAVCASSPARKSSHCWMDREYSTARRGGGTDRWRVRDTGELAAAFGLE